MRNMPRVYTSFMPNAPRVNGVPGTWLDVMKKCLNGGWTPFDITSIVVSAGVGTINFNYLDCSLPDYCYLTISGCDEPQLNTEICIEKGFVTMGEFSTTVADGTYTGTIKATPSPAGWDLLLSGTNTAIIRSSNLDSSKTVVKIDDTRALITGFDFGSDATSITNIIDKPNFSINDKFIHKSFNANGSLCRNWAIIADNTTVYFVLDSHSNQYTKPLLSTFMGGRWYGFGDYLPNNPSRLYPFFYFLSPVSEASTENYLNYIEGMPTVSFTSAFNINYQRTAVRSFDFSDSAWEMADFVVNKNSTFDGIRTSGTASNLIIEFADSILSNLIIPPVKVKPYNSYFLELGFLPGIRYSDYFLRPFFTPFKTVKYKKTNTEYILTPTSMVKRSSDIYEATMGVVPFVINKRWDL